MSGLTGRVAVVTGGSRGMGRAIALALARAGADCAITYRSNAAAGHEAAEEVERLGRRALALALDLREPDAVVPVIERIGQTFGRLDVLVANAAATAFRPMLYSCAAMLRVDGQRLLIDRDRAGKAIGLDRRDGCRVVRIVGLGCGVSSHVAVRRGRSGDTHHDHTEVQASEEDERAPACGWLCETADCR